LVLDPETLVAVLEDENEGRIGRTHSMLVKSSHVLLEIQIIESPIAAVGRVLVACP
jgi:hypothetical protein